MSHRLSELVLKQTAGIVAAVSDMQQLSHIWNQLTLDIKERETWDIIANSHVTPMRIDFISVMDLQKKSEEELSQLWIKYIGGPNRNNQGIYVKKR